MNRIFSLNRLLLLLALGFGSMTATAQMNYTVSGQVTTLIGNNPVANHTVYINTDSVGVWSYFATATTNSQGNYSHVIPIPSAGNVNIYVGTQDCQNQWQWVNLSNQQGTSTSGTADFQICSNGTGGGGGGGSNCNAAWTHTVSGSSVAFNNNSTNATDYFWDFGDGSTSTQANPTHTYSQSGGYYVCLAIYDSLTNCSDSLCDSIYVAPGGGGGGSGCAASYTYTIGGPAAAFTSTSTGTSFLTNHSWTVNGTFAGNGPTLNYQFNSTGTYTVCLTISDSSTNCYDTYCDTITYTGGGGGGGCQAYFSSGSSGLAASFTNLSTGSGLTYSWTFGDGNTSTQANPSHTYGSAGSYLVCLTVSGQGCTDTYCDSISVSSGGGGGLFGYLCGSVWTGNTTADYATVYLIQLDLGTGILSAVDSIDINPGDSGYYCFQGLNGGTFMVKAALNSNSSVYTGYLPTYHLSNLFWQGATNVTYTGNLWGVDINMIAGNNPGGPGFIGGSIFQGANKQSGPGDPVENALILLLDANDNPVAYTYSDSDGDFEFPNLAYGTYQVYAEVLDKPTEPAWVTIDAQNPDFTETAVVVNSAEVTTSIRQVVEGVSGASKVYPNPVEQQATINIEAVTATSVNLQVVDLLGRAVVTSRHNVTPGTNPVQLNVSELPAGVYLVNLQSEDGSYTYSTELVKR